MSQEKSTSVVYELTGSTRRYIVPFEYLSRQFVVVTVLGAGRTVLTLGSDYRFISLNEIETTIAHGGSDGNFLIEIRRVTSATVRLVEFADGSVLRSRDMNVSAIQTIHIAEEARDLSLTLEVNAKASEVAAKASEVAAKASELAAEGFATEAEQSAQAAAQSAAHSDANALRQDLTNLSRGAAMVARGVVAVDSIADLLALPAGQRREDLRYLVKEYHAGTGVGGGEFCWSAISDEEPNRGTVFAVPGVTVGRWHRSAMDHINVTWFGAVGDGVTDSSPAFQAAFDAVKRWAYPAAYSGGYTTIGTSSKVTADKGQYVLNSPLTFSDSYPDIDLCESILLPGPQFPLSSFAITVPWFYVGSVRNIKLLGFQNNFNVSNPNTDSGKLDFDNIQINGSDIGWQIDTRSSRFTVSNYKLDSVKRPAVITTGDKVIFKQGWFNPGAVDEDYGAFFEIKENSYSAGLELIDMFYVPREQNAEHVTVTRLSSTSRLLIERCIFGGEPGQVPLVANYGAAEVGGRGCHITIKDTMMYTALVTGRGTVELYELPNSIVFDNVSGLIEETHTGSLISFREDFQTFAEAEAKLADVFEIHLLGRLPLNFIGLPRSQLDQLSRYIVTRNKIGYGSAKDVTATQGHVVQELADWLLRRGQVYKVKLSNLANPGADRYSEYIVAGDFSGLYPSLVPIIEGTSTVAGRLVISGSGVEVRSNSTAASHILYTVEQVVTNGSGYP